MGWDAFVRVDTAVGGLIVLAAGAVAVAACRQPVRRIRLVLWSLLGAAALPILASSSVVPRWSLAVVPARAAIEPPRPAPPRLRPVHAAADVPAQPPAVAPAPAVEPGPAPARWERPTLAAMLIVAHAAGSAVVAGWWLLGQLAFARLVRSSRPAPPRAREVLREVAGPLADRVRLLESDRVASPCTNTWARPVILLPPDLAAGGDRESLRYALAHEWSHVERGDARAWNLAALLGLALFYQPLFWWLRRRLRIAQDEMADARAAAMGTAEDYAAFLVRLARSRQARPPWHALGIGERRSELFRRVVLLVQSHAPLESRCRPAWSLAVAATVAVVVVAASGLRLVAAAPAQEPPAAAAKKADGETLHYRGVVKDRETGAVVAGAEVTVRRSILTSISNRILEETHHTTAADGSYDFTIAPEQAAERSLYIELDVMHPDYAPREGFGYALGMIRKNEALGERPFFESVELRPARAIVGKVETPDGAPAAGVDLLAYSVDDQVKQPDDAYGSYARAKTAADGSFRLPMITPGKGVFWILPKDYAPESHELVDGRRGDLGAFRLKPGVRMTGRALDIDGKPLAGMLVQANRQGASVAGLPIADAVERTTETDAEGRFAFDPLPAGLYLIAPTLYDSRIKSDKAFELRPLPGVFLPIRATIAEGSPAAPLEIREASHVLVEGRWVDGEGRPARGWEIDAWGHRGDEQWAGRAFPPGPDGRFSVKVPRGLSEATVHVITNEHTAVVLRNGSQALGDKLDLGTLDHDVTDIEIVRYAAPLILIDARTKDGKRIDGFQAAVEYVAPAPGADKRVDLSGGDRKTEATRDEPNHAPYRTCSLIPDREVTVSVSADGFKPAERTMKLAEGKTEEATFVLEPN